MSKLACLLFLLLINPRAFADLAAIQTALLPQEAPVKAALKDAAELEPYTQLWTPSWKYPVPKTEVAARLGLDIATLSAVAKAHPANLELLLLTGLIARYGYNIDVPKSYDISLAALNQAEQLNHADIRPQWFRATLRCQTLENKAGADEFLAIEDSHSWDELPAAFWLDYMECATVTSMPAHVLRAGKHIQKLNPDAKDAAFLVRTAQKRFDPFDPAKEYAQKEVWDFQKTGNDVAFTSTTCGFRMHLQGDWTIDQLSLAHAKCVADISTGPYKHSGSKMRPSILVMLQQPKTEETLENYAKRFTTKGTFTPSPSSHCPAQQCISLKGILPGAYGKDGDGLAHLLVFERPQPEFPGLAFESPAPPPSADAKSGPQYFQPAQFQQRIPGKLYYLVLLDTAASIEPQAAKDFDRFLEQLVVE